MSKYFNALAVAVLGIAMLMGAASAVTSAGATVSGCLMEDDYFDFTDSLTDPTVADLENGFTDLAGGSLVVTAGGAFQIDCEEDLDGDGKMSGPATLTNELVVNGIDLVSATPVEVAAGLATNCGAASTESIAYTQVIDTADTTAGTYTISITYSIGADI